MGNYPKPGIYVQYGCGLCAPEEWQNYDVSPTLQMQRTPVLGPILKHRLKPKFPKNIKYGNIVKGLKYPENSCNGIYASHVLEHLSLQDFRKAVQNTLQMLKPGGVFRCIVPDLEVMARNYIGALDKDQNEASISFIKDTLMGTTSRPRGIKGFVTTFFGNSKHLWMWDYYSLSGELEKAGFSEIRRCTFKDFQDPAFGFVEYDEDRFRSAVAIECTKP
ncbi:MAG: methyltransferase domain-containing protein [Flavobacteriales bacterium]|nr:methyltransferase domain-containing protein [Flavobacteriales bacterium]